MTKKVKKQWSQPIITTSLRIKQTLSKGGNGGDGGAGNQNRS